MFVCGALFGISIALCVGAADKSSDSPKNDRSRLQVVSYAGGGTGIFDPDAGRLYLYDANLVNCYAIRDITTLGEPMRRVRN